MPRKKFRPLDFVSNSSELRLSLLDHHIPFVGSLPGTFAFTSDVEAYRVS